MQSRAHPIIAAFAVLFVGVFVTTYYDLYEMFPFFDKIMHFSGGFVAAWFFLVYLRDDMEKLTSSKTLLYLMGLTALVGILWEFAEYISDVYTPIYAPWFKRYLFIGDLPDTLGDLAVDITGGIVLWVISRLRRPLYRQNN